MQAQTTQVSVDEYAALTTSFLRHLRAAHKSPKTIRTYQEAVEQLGAFLRERGMPTKVTPITGEHIETYQEHLLETRAPATALNRHASLRAFFRWLKDDGEIVTDPMATVPRPEVPDPETDIPSNEDLKALLAVCQGSGFTERRDLAIVRTSRRGSPSTPQL